MADSKKKIIAHFVASSPPGDLPKVVKYIRKLASDEESLEDILIDACRDYHREQMTTVALPDGGRMPIVKQLCVGEDLYFNPGTKKTYKLNPVEASVEAADDVEDPVDAKFRDSRDALQAAVATMVKDHYGVATPETAKPFVASAVTVEADGSAKIFVSAMVIDERNYWTGRWKGVFTTPAIFPAGTAPESDGTPDGPAVAGSVEVYVRYSEDANTHFRLATSHKVPLRTKGATTDDAVASAVCAALRRADDDAQTQVESGSRSVQARAVKKLRRAMPMTKQPFDFTSGAHQLARELTKSKPVKEEGE